MSIELATEYIPYVDEVFKQESRKSLLTNQDFSFDGACTVKIYKISTSDMNDYGRNGAEEGNWSRYGAVKDLDATTETMILKRDRSFTFVIDALDMEETRQTLMAASALARQIRQVVVPEVDTYVYNIMSGNAGYKPVAPTKLEDYSIRRNPPGINGVLVEGRIIYDAFVMENKAKAIYYQEKATA